MKAMLIDCYRARDRIVLWLKTPEKDIRLERLYTISIYLEYSKLAESILEKLNLIGELTTRSTYRGEQKKVYSVKITGIASFERIVKTIEKQAKYKLMMYNADIPPEQMFLYENRLKPFTFVELQGKDILPLDIEAGIPLKRMAIELMPEKDIRIDPDCPLRWISINDRKMTGNEKAILSEFSQRFYSDDPDVLLMENAFSRLPYLSSRLEHHNIHCPLHRWDQRKIKKKGGKAFFSYGRVVYRDYAVRLNGRFLVDSSTAIGSECNIEGIVELSQLTGTRFQQVASRSFGASFQSALVYEFVKKNYLVPFKEKPVDMPVSMHTLMKFDRVGHTFDSFTGLHHDVAEIDFSSLFPWIIFNYNISPETLLGGEGPYQDIPGLPLKISLKKKGIVPTAIKPLLDRRMHYKKNPTSLNKAKIQGLKWVLVTSYGYLRFREFKLGIASSHMAIGAFAREILLKAKTLCEEKGFRIVHGIVDSLYIQKKGISEKDVKDICREIEFETGVPVSFEGLFKWIVFLPSVNDIKRPVPTRYYGVFANGEIKARGIEVRQHGVPKVVKLFQKKVLELISRSDTKEEIKELFPYLCQLIRKTLFLLPTLESDMLSSSVRVSKTEYNNNIPQKIAVDSLKKKGVSVYPGQKIKFMYAKEGTILPEDYNKKESYPDMDKYKTLLVRALFVVLQPFGFTKEDINYLTGYERQSKLREYVGKINEKAMNVIEASFIH
ncbi:MAG: hypothetical protein KKF44_09640 [Nanoarchaeota archaeon]|nr:hypothetical protein [Nanoarchaeota archaeon]